MSATLDVAVVDTTVVATLSGEIDAANASSLTHALIQAVEHDTGELRLDLARVDYIDSAGIHQLFVLGRDLEQRGAQLRLDVPPGSVVEQTLRYADALRQFGLDGASG
jgi:anti-anti-sigma factor